MPCIVDTRSRPICFLVWICNLCADLLSQLSCFVIVWMSRISVIVRITVMVGMPILKLAEIMGKVVCALLTQPKHPFNDLLTGQPGFTSTRQVNPFWVLMRQEMVGFLDGSGISLIICKQSAPRSRQITTPTPHHSIVTGPYTHTRLTALFPGLPRWAGTRKVKPIWILLKQETVSGSGISWNICKSAPHSRQITTPAPHHSVFYRPDALPAAQPTASKHWRHQALKAS